MRASYLCRGTVIVSGVSDFPTSSETCFPISAKLLSSISQRFPCFLAVILPLCIQFLMVLSETDSFRLAADTVIQSGIVWSSLGGSELSEDFVFFAEHAHVEAHHVGCDSLTFCVFGGGLKDVVFLVVAERVEEGG